ncbi:LAMI_0G04456g1_1 [Lachancea mirantina]|uniref:DNA replication regulator SLD2 n=1 Tax=Lachancea mirantina TaxID=1230905 RepID=A0A1G4K8H7_9SACH|nr:LAMI_0G04456g1_1 [Lachancea mirantina]
MLSELKIALKKWERDFERGNGKPPTHEDIKSFPEIKQKYKQYALLKNERRGSLKKAEETPRRGDGGILELGPTPQIYGKAISVFDMNMSPKSDAALEHNDVDEEAIPVRRNLNLGLQESPKLNAKLNAKFPEYSPVKLDVSLKMHITPRKDSKAGGDIISPINKHHQKSLATLAREHKEIMEEVKNWSDDEVVSGKIRDVFAEDQETESEVEEEPQDQESFRKKRSRRHILRPAKQLQKLQSETEPHLPDLHETMAQLKNGATTVLTTPASTTTPLSSRKSNRKSKYNLVSNNFRRLKLPKGKGKGNRRFGRRR